MVHGVAFSEDFSEYAVPKKPVIKDNFSVDNWVDNDSAKIGVSGVSSYSSDFTEYANQTAFDTAWVPNDTVSTGFARGNPTTDVIDFDAVADTTNDSIAFDLQSILGSGINASDDKWVLRFKLRYSTLSANDPFGGSIHSIGLSDSNQTIGSSTAQDFIGMQLYASTNRPIYAVDTDGIPLPTASGDNTFNSSATTGVDYFVEIIRTSLTSYSVEWFSDSSFTTSIGKALGTCSSSTTNLRYIVWRNATSGMSGAGNAIGIIDNIEFLNGGGLNYNFVKDGTDDSATLDLKVVSDRQWSLRFNLIVNTLTNPSSGTSLGVIGISNKSTLGGENFIGMMIIRNSAGVGSYRALSIRDGDILSGVDSSIFTTIPTTSDNYFIEIKRESVNSARMTIFSDSAYTVIVESKVFDISGGGAPVDFRIKDLRYIKLQNIGGTVTNGSIAGTIDNLLFVNGELGVTFQDDFSSYPDQTSADTTWVSSDTAIIRVNVTTDLIGFVLASDGTDNFISHDLGAGNVSDSRWTLRFSARVPSITSNPDFTIAITNQGTGVASDSVSHDFIGVRCEGTNALETFAVDGDGEAMDAHAVDDTIAEPWTATKKYYEIARTSATTYTVKVFSDSAYTNQLLRTMKGTCTATTNGLRYIRICERVTVNATSATVEIDNIEFFNGQGVTLFQDDFSSYVDQTSADTAYPTTDTARVRVNVTTDKIDWTEIQDNTDDTIYHDLGLTISDINWELKFKLDITTATFTSGNNHYFVIGISDNTSNWVSSSDGIVLWFRAGITNPFIRLASTNGSGITGVPNNLQLVTATAVSTRYIKLSRLSSTVARLELFSDPNYTSLIERRELIIPSTITNLRYVKIGTTQNTSDGLSMSAGTIDDIEFFNGTESRPLLPRLLDVFLDDFSDTDRWIDTGTKVKVNTTTDVIDWDCRRDGSDHHTSYDLGVGRVSNNNWLLRWKCTILTATAGSTASQYTVLLSSSDAQSETAQDHVTFAIQLSNNGDRVANLFVDAGTQIYTGDSDQLGTNLVGAGSTFYCELKRSGSVYSSTIYSDPDFIEILGRATVTSTDTLNSLRYIKVTNRTVASTTGSYTGTMDNVEFFNGVSVTKTPIEELKYFEDDFSGADSWIDSGTGHGVNVATDVIDSNTTRKTTMGQTSLDLGAGNVSDINWTLRMKLNVTTLIAYTSGVRSGALVISLGNSLSDFDTGSQDQISLSFNSNAFGINFWWANDQTPLLGFATNSVLLSEPLAVKTFYVEIKRESATSCRASLFSDPDYSQLLATQTKTNVPVGLTGLRYIRIWDVSSSVAVSGDGQIIAEIDDVQFWNRKKALIYENKYLVIG